jgi:hypothetical protein
MLKTMKNIMVLILFFISFLTIGGLNNASGTLKLNRQKKLMFLVADQKQPPLRCEFKVFNGKTKSFEKLLYKGCKTQKKNYSA